MSRRNRQRKVKWPVLIAVAVLLVLSVLSQWYAAGPGWKGAAVSLENIPDFSGEPFVVIGDNRPDFSEEDLTEESYEYYSPLDALGRCGYTIACVGRDIMPTEDRESISNVKPTGWVQAQYDCVEAKNLYNRCHLIGFQLTGENANECNLITGTRFCNTEGMLPFENMVADYVKETGNHVLYRVTPIFQTNELVARGIHMEAFSVEDEGAGVCFNVFVYNCQPGVVIDYATGESRLAAENGSSDSNIQMSYILNVSSKKFHKESCSLGQDIKASNKKYFTGSREDLIQQGYSASKCCNP